jgi:hypothetical protein
MDKIDHPKFLAIGFALFAAIFAFTFLLLMLVSLGVFVALGITFTKETGDPNQAGVGIVGGVFAVIFYGVLGLIFVLPTALAAWKLWKNKRNARMWSIIASIVLLPVMPMGTALGIYGLWFLFRSDPLSHREIPTRHSNPTL